ncbi:hypothetical protein IAQ67_28665 (plasmid) [Paenibacillus peoriae]|uniref:Uncharacterized protein n=1 Tax=Paenibacillus peoriae TaxID=59893 RepID=A0A7H0YHC7_9BACL|nr:hypothetical protein [Paenibacillus peoriae]QNR70485.1 hypothetical protein IAQ67_28665 [Paenibacillus peoriae]
MDKTYLENQMGVKLYTMTEFAEYLGWTQQRLSKIYHSQIKGAKVRTKVPDPVFSGLRLLWTEGQVKQYKKDIRPNYKPEWRKIDGKQVYGRVCRMCTDFKRIEDMSGKNSPYCYTCISRKGGEKRRLLGETTSKFKPRSRVHVRKYNPQGKLQCRTCKIFKDVAEFRAGTSPQLRPDCKDCLNARRRERYAKKGDSNE